MSPEPPASGPEERREPGAGERRSAIGLALIGLGLLAILWGVFHVLNAIGGYDQRDFAHRKRDAEVRAIVHERFPGAALRGVFGLALIVVGSRLRGGPIEP